MGSAKAKRLQDGGIISRVRAGPEFRPVSEAGRQERAFEKLAPVIADLVLETEIPASVCTLLPLQDDRTAVWHDQSSPNQQHARLSERDLAVIDADQAGALRN